MMEDEGDSSRHSYIPGWSASGFIVYDHPIMGQQRFYSLWATHHNPFLPISGCTICASAGGLLLCHFPDAVTVRRPYAYAVCNPYIHGSTRHIPNPNPLHQRRILRVLVAYVHPTTRLRVFHIVCATLEGDDSPVYTFDVYSSNTDRWTSRGSHDLGFLREDTGVSCGTKAYWLRRDAPMAAHYDTVTNSVGNVALPDAYVWLFSRPGNLRSQLGQVRNRLCLVVATDNLRAVYTVGDGGSWVCSRQDIVQEVSPLPVLSRFEDYRLRVPFWFEAAEQLDIWDSSWADYMRSDSVSSEPVQQVDFHDDILPLVHTRRHPVRDFPCWLLLQSPD